MGGHKHHIEGNPQNIKETDAELQGKIRRIELIKHNPQLFHLAPFSFNNIYDVSGGFKTLAFTVAGGLIAVSYFVNQAAYRPYNFYVLVHQSFGRFLFGSAIGGTWGFLKFGDRQKLHNAWVAERLRRRYPESKSLAATDLWQYKDIEASHEYYRWR